MSQYCFPPRFEAKVDRMGPVAPVLGTRCWIWTACKTKNGYGRLTFECSNWLAHVFAYVRSFGPIPAGRELDHLCRVRERVNPDHLEPVTRLENVRRGNGNQHRGKTHCKRGHEFTPENTKITSKGSRQCMACVRLNYRRRRLV